MRSLSCRYGSHLLRPQSRNWRLTSLSLWGIPVAHELLSPFLKEHAGTLQELGLAFWRRYTRGDVMELPKMPCLRRVKLFAALAGRIREMQGLDIGRLERVQREQAAMDRTVADTKGGRGLRGIDWRVRPEVVKQEIDVPGEARREVEVVYDLSYMDVWSDGLTFDVERNGEVVRVLVARCASLKTVTFSGA